MSTSPAFDLIVFDWDGTLFDSTQVIVRCIQRAAQDLGATVPTNQQASYVIGMALPLALRYAVPDLPNERNAELVERYRHHYALHHNDLALFEGILPLLQALKTRYKALAVATGKSRMGLNESLNHTQIKGLFNSSRTADETRSKPHPQMLHELIEELGVTHERTLMIGDTIHDLEMARNAGCPSVGVSYGAHAFETFTEYKPLLVAHTVEELHRWLID